MSSGTSYYLQQLSVWAAAASWAAVCGRLVDAWEGGEGAAVAPGLWCFAAMQQRWLLMWIGNSSPHELCCCAEATQRSTTHNEGYL